MGGVLEAGKLAMTSFLYRYWERIPSMLKWYCTIAVVVLIGITSLGIYGFLSDAYDDTRSRVEMHENNIETLNKEIVVIETEIETLKNTDVTVEDKKTETIAGFQRFMMILYQMDEKDKKHLLTETKQTQGKEPPQTTINGSSCGIGQIKK